MRRIPLSLAFLAVAGLAVTAAVRADEDAGVKPRIERAQDVAKALDRVSVDLNRTIAAVQTSGKQAPEDLAERLTKLSDELDATVLDVRKLAKPITLAELTGSERKSLAKEMAKQTSEAKEDPLAGWQQRALERALEGAELSEEQELAAREVVSKWMTDAWDARREGDSKRSSDLKRERDQQLIQALGRRKARKVINNLNSLYSRGR